MNSASHRQAMDLLYEVAQRPVDERAAFLEQACQGDGDLKAEVESLLAYSDCETDAFSDTMLVEQNRRIGAAVGLGDPGSSELVSGAGMSPSPHGPRPTRFGRYEIVRVLGEGGMGCVYEAVQDEPRRTVALKAIKPGVTSKRLMDRLRREANVLARLQHRGIAQVFDAGVVEVDTPTGMQKQPFFAMELVEGERLDAFAQRNELDDEARLRLVAEVCDAVQHAHERGVLHRDLKFSNILVTRAGQPKVLDFGVSRIIAADSTLTVETETGELLGTVPYMSPEQVEGDPEKLDRRSDVYALGVLCFELLSGRLPYELDQASLPEMTRIIRFEDPLTLGGVSKRFRGDIQTMVAKALQKEPAQRYASAGAFAGDILRHLAAEPIAPRPPTTVYQLQKFARRNRGLVAGVVGMFVMLVVGLAGTTWFALEAGRERDAAQVESRRVAALNAFLVDDLFGAANPDSGGAVDRSVADLLADAAGSVEDAFADDPETEIVVRAALGKILRRIGQYDASEQHLRPAFELALERHGPAHVDTLAARRSLAITLWRKNAFDEARDLLAAQLEIQQGDAATEPIEQARTISSLGDVAYESGQYDEAETRYRRVAELLEVNELTKHDFYTEALNDIANVMHNAGRVEESLDLHREVLALRLAQRGPDDLNVAQSRHNMGVMLVMLGRTDEAESALQEALDVRQRLVGDVHPDVADTLQQLGRARLRARDPQGARAFAARALALQRELLPEKHGQIAFTLDLLAKAAVASGDLQTHEKCHREAYEIYIATEGPESRAAANSLSNIGTSLRRQDRCDEALEVYAQALELARKVHPPGSAIPGIVQTSLAVCQTSVGNYAEAHENLLDAREQLAAAKHPAEEWAVESLVELYQAWDRPDLLEALRAEE